MVIEGLQCLEARIVVPSHGDLGDTGLLAVTHAYLTLVRSEVNRLAAEGRGANEIIALLTPHLHARYPDWDPSEPWRIVTGVQTFLAQ